MRRIFILGIFLIFLLNFVGAIDIGLREEYSKRESAIGEISGVVLGDINSANVFLKKANLEIPFEYGVVKIEGKYYIWIITPAESGNYSLIIEDVLIFADGEQKIVDLKKDFHVGENLSDYNIKPGAINTNKDFEIDSFLFEENEIEIETNIPYSMSLKLRPGQNKIKFYVSEIEGIKSENMQFGKYQIPAYIIGTKKTTNTSVENNQTNSSSPGQETNQSSGSNDTVSIWKELILAPELIRSKNIRGEPSRFYFTINNPSNISRLVSIGYDPEKIILRANRTFYLGDNESKKIEFYPRNYSEELNEKITLNGEWGKRELSVEISFTENESEVLTEVLKNSSKESLYYCSELGGSECSAEQTCSSEETMSLDGSCCLDECVALEEQGSWTGYIIAGVLIVILIIVFLKYRKTGKTIPGKI